MSNPIPTTPPPRDPDRTIEFFWDPVCPFAWLASRWIEEVRAETGLTVDWRFISLRLINKDKDYPTHFPALDPVVTAYGESYFDKPRGSGMRDRLSTPDHLVEVLTTAGIDLDFASAADDTAWDEMIDAEGEMALSRTGRDVGTPIISFGEDGLSFFGPVISRIPRGSDAVKLWESVNTLAAFPGFAEMKRSLRETPQLNILGGLVEQPVEEDWEAGHRRMND
ncbi:MAG: hypothetical protein EBY57_00285 [Actinobacteria bacterium]|nr:hypothetical protein [Actinomycetota bacterium]